MKSSYESSRRVFNSISSKINEFNVSSEMLHFRYFLTLLRQETLRYLAQFVDGMNKFILYAMFKFARLISNNSFEVGYLLQ